jgi:hypothetical protein
LAALTESAASTRERKKVRHIRSVRRNQSNFSVSSFGIASEWLIGFGFVR